MTHVMAMAIDRARTRFGDREWLKDAEVFEFVLEIIVATLGAMHPSGIYNGPGNRGLQFHIAAKEEARELWRNIIERDQEDPLNRHRNIAEDLGDLLQRPNVYRAEYNRRVLERTGTLMRQEGIPLDSTAYTDAERPIWLIRRGEFLIRAGNEVEKEMIAEGKDPRINEEENI